MKKSTGSTSLLESPPPEAWEPLLRLAKLATRPLERFLQIEAASGILLLVATALALVWANSPWADGYIRFWETPLGVRIGTFEFERSLAWVVNDGLMVIFFFVVGLEIRREVHHGELSEWRRAALPVAAALGGVMMPAFIYLFFAGGPETRSGWGVPMATDIAFAVGVLTLLGKRVPPALRVLLLALAVIDDLFAIIVIALFYSAGVSFSGLFMASLGIVGIFSMQRLGVRSKAAYIVPSLVVWGGIYSAGIHPTIAGVLIGVITPLTAWLGPDGLTIGLRKELDRLMQASARELTPRELAASLRNVDRARREALSPAESLIENLHPWVAFGIMPLFALANAGVAVSGVSMDAASLSVITGVSVGLLAGKPIGIFCISVLTLRLRITALPAGLTYRHLVVLGTVAGVGFTMALFLAQLAFNDPALLAAAKVGVLAASGSAGVLGLMVGRLVLAPRTLAGAAQTADEAETSTSA